MPPQRDAQTSYNEGTVQLTILALKRDDVQSEKRAAAIYKVPRTTLHARRAGRPSRRDCEPNSKRLTKLEEDSIVRYILDLDSRGIGATRAMVQDMASSL